MNALRANGIAVAQKPIVLARFPGPLTEGPFGEGILRNGHAFRVARSFGEVDVSHVTGILEASFAGKKVAPGFFDRTVDQIIIEKNDRALAITMTIEGLPGAYLDKIAVTPQAQGTGIAQAVMGHLQQTEYVLTWRATKENPANAWYARISETTVEMPHWNVYGWGISGTEMAHAAQIISRLPPTMLKE